MDRTIPSSPNPEWTEAVRTAVRWFLMAAVLALASNAVDRRTTLDVFSDGGRIHLEVSGTYISAPRTVRHLTAVEILAMDSVHPPGGRFIRVATEKSEVLNERLPKRFQIPPGELTPLGDWELDEGAGWGTVWYRETDVHGPFTLEASLTGRFLHDLTVVLHGDPTTSISVRRGIINDDCFIRNAAGVDLASTSIDPIPLADLGAIAATAARAAAVACSLIACFTLLHTGARSRLLPAASPRLRAAPLVLALAMAAVALSGWVARDILEGLPHTPDSLVYLLQAGWVLDGTLWGQVPPLAEFIHLPFTYVDDGRWLAHYPAGWPLLLALGVAVGAPWIVAPLLGGAFVVLIYLAGRELHGPELGLTAATLAVISPFARLIFGSLLSHAAAATLVLAALFAALRARRLSSWPAAAAAGAAVGWAFGIRPLTAVAVSLPLLALASVRQRHGRIDSRSRLLAGSFLGAAVLASLPTMAANAAITGSPWSFPYSLVEGSMFGAANLPFGLRNLDALMASGGGSVTGWGWHLLHGPWVMAVSFAFACVPLLTKSRRSTDWALAAMMIGLLVAHLGTRGHGLHGFGPRYHFEALAPFFLLTARGFFVLAGLGAGTRRQEKRMPILVAFALFFALCLPAAAILPDRLSMYRGYNGVDGRLLQQLTAGSIDRAVIVLPPGEWQGWAAAWPEIEFENDPEFLFLQTDANDPAIAAVAGDRPVYLWRDHRLLEVDADAYPEGPP